MTPADKIIRQLLQGNNVLITGSRGSGKSTLFNDIRRRLPVHTLLRSEKVARRVWLYSEAERAVIGRWQGGKMVADLAGFGLALQAIRQFLKSQQVILAVDEIGFLEADHDEYLNLLLQSAQQKTLLAVLRKPNHAFAARLAQLQPYFLYDLDDGCE